jgi:DNA-directed RNA polymerase subunit RPC12/RpoP
MRAVCSFCKTDFRTALSGAGKCPVCGHRTFAAKKNPTMKFFIVALLFLAASLFAVVALNTFDRNKKSEFLSVSISDVKNAGGGYVVRGNIRNFSDRTYSVPDLMFLLKTESGTILGQVVQLPPSGLIEPMSDIEFVRKIEPVVMGAQKISVQFAEE